MEAGVVRAVSGDNLRVDPLRMLRAYRFAASLNWRPALDTVAAIVRHHALIQNVAPERIHEELSRILTSGRADAAFAAMAESGLLFDIVPELRPLMGLIQNPRYHAHDGWTHTLAVVRRLQEILNHPESMMPADVLPMMTAWLSPEIRGLLLWIALLHDVAKPVMSRPGPSGAPRFHGHDAEGGRMAAEICRRLRFPGRHVGTVADIVSRHMRPLSLFQARRRGELGQRGIMRFFRENEWKAPLIALHAMADALGKNGGDGVVNFVGFCQELIREYAAVYVPGAARPPLLTGREIMTELAIGPSRLVGDILEALAAERLVRPDLTRSQALEIARSLVRPKKNPAESGDRKASGDEPETGQKKSRPERAG